MIRSASTAVFSIKFVCEEVQKSWQGHKQTIPGYFSWRLNKNRTSLRADKRENDEIVKCILYLDCTDWGCSMIAMTLLRQQIGCRMASKPQNCFFLLLQSWWFTIKWTHTHSYFTYRLPFPKQYNLFNGLFAQFQLVKWQIDVKINCSTKCTCVCVALSVHFVCSLSTILCIFDFLPFDLVLVFFFYLFSSTFFTLQVLCWRSFLLAWKQNPVWIRLRRAHGFCQLVSKSQSRHTGSGTTTDEGCDQWALWREQWLRQQSRFTIRSLSIYFS